MFIDKVSTSMSISTNGRFLFLWICVFICMNFCNTEFGMKRETGSSNGQTIKWMAINDYTIYNTQYHHSVTHWTVYSMPWGFELTIIQEYSILVYLYLISAEKKNTRNHHENCENLKSNATSSKLSIQSKAEQRAQGQWIQCV